MITLYINMPPISIPKVPREELDMKKYPQYNYSSVASLLCGLLGVASVTMQQVEYYIGMRLEFGLTIIP